MTSQYSPPGGEYPQELPDYWKFDDGTVREDLQTLSDAELLELGWQGPITMPRDYFSNDYEWNSETLSFDAVEIDQLEKESRVCYQWFWDELLDAAAYQRIRTEAKTSLPANVLATEFISLMSDARRGPEYANPTKIQACLTEILSTISFTTEELTELQQIFNDSGMSAIYTLA